MQLIQNPQPPYFIPTIPPNLNWETHLCKYEYKCKKNYICVLKGHIMRITNMSKQIHIMIPNFVAHIIPLVI